MTLSLGCVLSMFLKFRLISASTFLYKKKKSVSKLVSFEKICVTFVYKIPKVDAFVKILLLSPVLFYTKDFDVVDIL